MSVLDNKLYREMELADGVYVPDLGIDYPVEDPLSRIVPVRKVRDIKTDESYPFLDDSLKFRFWYNLVYLVAADIFLRVYMRLGFGLKVKGREILKKYKKELSGSYVTVCNHCFRLDGLCVHLAIGRKLRIPMLSDLLTGSDWFILKHFGGIPLADGSLSATRKFNAAFDEFNRRGEVVHVFAEARSWPFYKPLRPFQKGAFTMAYRWGAPVLPLNLSYRPRTGIYRLFGKKNVPLLTINIGTPIFPDKTAPRKAEVDRLLVETHAAICRLGGIVKNPWPAVWND